jgi:hypothetical protein
MRRSLGIISGAFALRNRAFALRSHAFALTNSFSLFAGDSSISHETVASRRGLVCYNGVTENFRCQ